MKLVTLFILLLAISGSINAQMNDDLFELKTPKGPDSIQYDFEKILPLSPSFRLKLDTLQSNHFLHQKKEKPFLNRNPRYYSTAMPIAKPREFQTNMPVMVPDSSVNYSIKIKKIEGPRFRETVRK